jgi:hypothetical protein
MPSVASPFGLRPAYHPSGNIRPVASTITTAYGSNIYQGSPVGFIADGSIALSAAGGTGVTGAVGAFQGVEYTGTDGRRRVSNYWPASTSATEIVAYITSDPAIVYAVQTSATMAQTAVGAQYDWSTNDTSAGSTTTGLSNVSLNAASNAANAGLRVLGLVPDIDNAWGDTYVNVYVQLSEHQYVATIAQI